MLKLPQKAKEKHPNRWSGETRNWEPAGNVLLNPERCKSAPKEGEAVE